MLFLRGSAAFVATTLLSSSVVCQNIPTPSVAPGYNVQVVASGLESPRGIIFDKDGNLLVVQQGVGIVALRLQQDSGSGDVSVATKETVIDDSSLNHGIELSPDGKTLYASNPEAVYSYSYDSSTTKNITAGQTLVTNMTNSDHTTRTLLLSKKAPGVLIVTRGSTSNIDTQASDIETGHSQIKAFNLDNMTGPYDFNADGLLLGWGLRNDVGIAEEPTLGGLYSVENSVDQMSRLDTDIHATNPAEELNYLGTLVDNNSTNQGSNFGYPECYSAWDVSIIPDNDGIEVGTQFAIGTPNSTVNDRMCQEERTAPRLVFESHMAPLDIKFNENGTEAWVSFHGSWNRSPESPSGYKVSRIPFADGEPVADVTSQTGYEDIVSNPNNDECPDNCFRPAGLAWDSQGRLYFSSDASGEIYMITKSSSQDGSDNVSGTDTSDNPPNSAIQQTGQCLAYVLIAAVAVAAFVL